MDRKSETDSLLHRSNPSCSKISSSMSLRRRSTLRRKVSSGSSGTLPTLSPSSHPDPFPFSPSLVHPTTANPTLSNRGLDFTSIALSQNVASASEELSVSFRDAYGATLKPHHSFLVKPIFSAAMSATPYRKDFYAKLGADLDEVAAQLRVWLASLEKILAILKAFLDRKEAKW